MLEHVHAVHQNDYMQINLEKKNNMDKNDLFMNKVKSHQVHVHVATMSMMQF